MEDEAGRRQRVLDKHQAQLLREEADRAEQEGNWNYAEKMRAWAVKLEERSKEEPTT